MTSRKRMGTAMQRLLLAAALLAATPLLAQTPAAAQAISPQDQKGIDGDINRHFGDAPPIPAQGEAFRIIAPADVRAATRKVADWELPGRSRTSTASGRGACCTPAYGGVAGARRLALS